MFNELLDQKDMYINHLGSVINERDKHVRCCKTKRESDLTASFTRKTWSKNGRTKDQN